MPYLFGLGPHGISLIDALPLLPPLRRVFCFSSSFVRLPGLRMRTTKLFPAPMTSAQTGHGEVAECPNPVTILSLFSATHCSKRNLVAGGAVNLFRSTMPGVARDGGKPPG
eukprot:4501561-Amphidinium_carterae.1